jgi:hypothetical protein
VHWYAVQRYEVTKVRGQSDVVPCAHNAIVCTRRQHKTSCLGSLPGASIPRILSPNIVIHWRFSENECEVPRSEVSPRTRKAGVRGRVVEIGANRQSCDPSIKLLFKLVLEVVMDVADSLRAKESAP